MSLNVDYREVKKEISQEESFRIGMYLVALGIPEVNEKTVPELRLRDSVFAGVYDSLAFPSWSDLIGFKANVAFETRSKWFTRITKSIPTLKRRDIR
jgi:hypothetical protein